MAVDNQFTRIAQRYNWLPEPLRRPLISWAIGRTIRFVGTAGLKIDTLTPTRVSGRLPNRSRVQNHVGGLHAAAMALLVETVTGLVVALNVPGESTPVLRTLNVSFQRRAEGALTAEATLAPEESERIQHSSVGKLDVPVTVTDASDHTPITCTLQWAWLPTKRVLSSAA